MTEALALMMHKKLEGTITEKIVERVDGCGTNGHWIIKDPKPANKAIYLSPKDIGHPRKGRVVSIRRVIFFFNRNDRVPRRNIKMVCGERWCVNPAHGYIPGYEPTHQQVMGWVADGYLTLDDAKDYWEDIERN